MRGCACKAIRKSWRLFRRRPLVSVRTEGGEKIGVARMHDEKDIKWTDEAEERLQRLPFSEGYDQGECREICKRARYISHHA